MSETLTDEEFTKRLQEADCIAKLSTEELVDKLMDCDWPKDMPPNVGFLLGEAFARLRAMSSLEKRLRKSIEITLEELNDFGREHTYWEKFVLSYERRFIEKNHENE